MKLKYYLLKLTRQMPLIYLPEDTVAATYMHAACHMLAGLEIPAAVRGNHQPHQEDILPVDLRDSRMVVADNQDMDQVDMVAVWHNQAVVVLRIQVVDVQHYQTGLQDKVQWVERLHMAEEQSQADNWDTCKHLSRLTE